MTAFLPGTVSSLSIVPLVSLLIVLLAGSPSNAQVSDSSRTDYWFFRPVPRAKMRPMQLDRPDVTESAFTVDAGHFQLETDLLKFTTNRSGSLRSQEWAINVANLKLGLSTTTDLQLVVESYLKNKANDDDLGPLLHTSGTGDLTLRLKQNLSRNAGGKFAVALMPYLTFPVSKFSSPGIQGGLIVPASLPLSDRMDLGFQVAAGRLKSDDGDYRTELLETVTVSRSLNDYVSFFVEAIANTVLSDRETAVYADGGLVFSITDNIKFDIGLNYGLTKQSDKVYFAGFSFRY